MSSPESSAIVVSEVDRGRNAMSSLIGAGIGAVLSIASLSVHPLIGIPLFSIGGVTVGAATRRSLKHGLTLNDFAAGLAELGDDIEEFVGVTLEASDRLAAPMGELIYSKLPDRLQAALPREVKATVDDSDGNWFLNVRFWRGSKFIFGRKGSGKTFLLYYESWVIKQHYPDATIYLIDPHLGQDSKWFGGDRKLMAAHCYKTAKQIALAFDAVAAELDRRIENDLRDEPLCKFIADEIESVVNGFANLPARFPDNPELVKLAGYAQKIPAIIAAVQDEGEKFNVEGTVGAHGGKKGRSGIDSDILTQMHWIACDDAIEFPNTPVLQTLKTPKEKLIAARQELTEYAGEGLPFAGTAILRQVKSHRSGIEACEKAIGLPWIDFSEAAIVDLTAEPELDPEAKWIKENRDRVALLIQEGKDSVRKLADALKIRRQNDRPDYRALKALFAELTGDKEETEIQDTVEV